MVWYNLVKINSDNGLSSVPQQIITWINDDILSFEISMKYTNLLETNNRHNDDYDLDSKSLLPYIIFFATTSWRDDVTRNGRCDLVKSRVT